MSESSSIAARKAHLRVHYLARRASRGAEERVRLEQQLSDRAAGCDCAVVAAFVPVAGEPGSVEVLEVLRARAQVLLPITERVGEPLRWAAYDGVSSLERGPYGLLQPRAGTAEARLRDAEIVLVPAVAMGLDGTRLGHGGGFYDRALEGLPTERLYGVVHDDEVADTLPVDAHDIRLGWVLTPTALHRVSLAV